MRPASLFRLFRVLSFWGLFLSSPAIGDNFPQAFAVIFPDEVEDRIEKYKENRQNLTMCLLCILVRHHPISYGVRFTSYEYKGRFYEITTRYRPLDQFEIIEMARKYMDAGADINGLLPKDYTVESRSGQRYEYKKGDSAIILALKSGYDYVAYALYTYTNAPVPLTRESRKAVKAFSETNGPSLFQTFIHETDHGLIERLAPSTLPAKNTD